MIIIGSDHAGFSLKEKLKKYLNKRKISFIDIGAYSLKKNDDYPDYAEKLAKAVASNKKNKGILVCATGTGMVIAANKVKGARAVNAYDLHTARMSRLDNDANILCLRGKGFPFEKTKRIVSVWLNTKFSGKARHKRRLEKISKLEK
ncbi:ribose 5-phosphate isomerase B [Candidatus Woesearchaeota archaeon]|nr:MAG: ribose 5-phosphate isomerase B [Candidatus Woesearchaeota archaeon]